MDIKDYYKILEIAPSATQQEIKKAFRKLAQQYHPDKNNNEPYGAARFAEIKEAYEVLTDPAKKEYYLQQRWYNQSTGYRRTQDIITPVNVLKQAIELERYVSRLDQFRMDKEGLYDYIADLVTDSSIEKLNMFNDLVANREIIGILLQCLKPLPLPYVLLLQKQIDKISTDSQTKEFVNAFIAKRQHAHKRDKLKIWIILLLVTMLCLLIFFMAAGKTNL